MSRPQKETITNISGWNIPVEANAARTFQTPFPPAEYADFASLPLATSYEGCIAFITDEDLLVKSEGGVWKRMGTQSDFQTDSTATGVTDLKADFNALLAKLQAANLMASS